MTGSITFIAGTLRLEWIGNELWAGRVRIGRVFPRFGPVWVGRLEGREGATAHFRTDSEAKAALVEAARTELYGGNHDTTGTG